MSVSLLCVWSIAPRQLCLCAILTSTADLLNFIVGQMLESDEGVVRPAHADELVELDLNGGGIPVCEF